ncbi:MAG: ATP-dependent nuclease [Phenylobacterium sp.]|uniref:ATP-dependent nuclease n=1 Tax=Phenylobacterium sp. TaxID=1871053 RepID=UPI003919572B
MHVVDLRIENFRGVREGHVRFGKHTVLVGPNNSGKTTIIEALALLFGRDRMVRTLTEHDFYGSDPQPIDRIRLIATIAGFEDNNFTNHPDWFRDDRAIPKWWNPATGDVTAVRPADDAQLACQIGFLARFDRNELEVETLRYFHDDDAVGDLFVDESATLVPSRLIRDIGYFLVPASRTWDRVVSFGSELFRRVIASAGGHPSESVLGERDRLRRPNQPLESDTHLQPIIADLNAELAGFFHAGPTLQLRVTTTDSEGLLDAVMPHYATGVGLGVPARRHGSGLLSLQHLLLLLQFGRQRAAAGEGFWMALEEPELHVPPPLQRRLVHRIQALSSQTFVSTHSPMVAATANPASVVVLRNDGGRLTATSLLPGGLPAATPNGVRKLFQLNRVDTIGALIHDAVLVPEGRLDFEWLRLLMQAVDLGQGWGAEESRFSARIGLIPTHDAAIVASISALECLHPRLCAVVDGDAAGQGYRDELCRQRPGPQVVVQWPAGWTIEDVVGWILQVDSAGAIGALAANLPAPPPDVPTLVANLKSEVRAAGGLKGDLVAYEAVADAASGVDLCRRRAQDLLNGLCDALLGSPSPLFVSEANADPRVKTFRP